MTADDAGRAAPRGNVSFGTRAIHTPERWSDPVAWSEDGPRLKSYGGPLPAGVLGGGAYPTARSEHDFFLERFAFRDLSAFVDGDVTWNDLERTLEKLGE